MRRVYLDSAPVIYLVERTPGFYARVQAVLQPSDWLVVSDITRMECRVLPLRNGNNDLLRDFDDFFAQYVNELVPLTTAVIDQATEIRATYRYTPLDSIHLAAAMVARCNLFLTNDVRLAGFQGIQVVTVSSG
ncbi:MAG: PIN domain-containing protein [Armatimonadota bacterium]|nr:PIN domain-containing protein [Armatimonadota bacterium]